MSAATVRIEAQFSVGVWTSFGNDVLADRRVRWNRGMVGNTPLDRIASIGSLEFTLRNDKGVSGGVAGYYSPNHASCRTGFTFGIPVRLIANDGSGDQTLWRGKLRTILPTPGKELASSTLCTARDPIGDLAEATVREISPQVSQTEVALLQAIVAALPTDAQPPATSYDTALDTYPYAFDDLGNGAKALDAAIRVVTSAQGLYYSKADGTVRYDNRHTISVKSSSVTLSEAQILADNGLVVPSSLANVYNRVRVTIHPKTTAAATVLFSLSGAQAIGPGHTVTIWGDYFDPTNTLKLIGGTSVTTPIVATTDYLGNSQADGLGSDLTASLSIVTSAFASSVKFAVTNTTTAQTIYLTTLQVRGTAIYDNAPQTFESFTAQTYGDRPLDVDLPYQSDGLVAQDLADYLKAQYLMLGDQADEVSFDPQVSATLMTQALTREIGDVITLTETQTGLSSVQALIVGIQGEASAGAWLRHRFLLAPQAVGSTFIFDDSVYGVLDAAVATLGYA